MLLNSQAPLFTLCSIVMMAVAGCEPATVPTSEPLPADTAEAVSPQAPVDAAAVLKDLSAPGTKQLLMHYMPWYETPQVRQKWGAHWTGHKNEHDPSNVDEKGLPDIWSHNHPLIGLYDSTDPDVLECQLLEMKLSGVNGVIVDWYGIAEAADFPDIHLASQAMFDACGTHGMKFAACYEDRTVKLLLDWGKITLEEIPRHVAENFRWLGENWFPKPQYFQFEGEPLLLNFGPIFVTDSDVWAAAKAQINPEPRLFGLHHLWQGAGMDGGFSWVHTEPFNGDSSPDEIICRLTETHAYRSPDPSKAIPSAYPGFNDIYEKSLLSPLDRRGGRTIRETLRAAIEGPWPLIQLVTWNDYGEGTVIEPTHEDGYDALEAIQEVRRRELGEKFTFTPEDLRLPARLLALRKANIVPKADLDRISTLLGNGRCSEASALLDQAEK